MTNAHDPVLADLRRYEASLDAMQREDDAIDAKLEELQGEFKLLIESLPVNDASGKPFIWSLVNEKGETWADDWCASAEEARAMADKRLQSMAEEQVEQDAKDAAEDRAVSRYENNRDNY